MSGRPAAPKLIWVSAYAVAMAFVESAVVVYLRAIYYPSGFAFPIAIIPDSMVAIEVGREAATLLMLLVVAVLAGSDRWERFLCFCLAFGVWDIFYYAWLEVFLGWPPSLLTWDILFLIPVPWVGPVLAPLIVSLGLVLGALWLLRLKAAGTRLAFPGRLWALAIAGGLLVLASFTVDYEATLLGKEPPPFRWWLFAPGAGAGVAALALGTRSLKRNRTAAPPER